MTHVFPPVISTGGAQRRSGEILLMKDRCLRRSVEAGSLGSVAFAPTLALPLVVSTGGTECRSGETFRMEDRCLGRSFVEGSLGFVAFAPSLGMTVSVDSSLARADWLV